ncbi:SPARC-related modular calcium-binding protein 1-like isoform X2 [Cololabis saira]|uniref:SPARC-related modular calcium-binding protein 1-like isoform X2 n=1 Tax=Cololabis saira TaxID=129043 RepID=UPI002AD46C17|nr:SPARC-related modular calcium-binding protein 1-like isoform X2 [Cololabis saira]
MYYLTLTSVSGPSAMLVLVLVLVLVLLSESVPVQSGRKTPFLITENMWLRGCVLDCQRGRHRAVCGSNGRLYKSLCAFQRAQCINTLLRLAPRAHCADPTLTKCQLARAQGLEARARSSGSVFVPECSPEGNFLPLQCHSQAGYCWCSTPDGKPVSSTTVLQGIPNCTDAAGDPAPTSDPRKPAELTAPAFWVTILINSESRGNRSGRQPTESPQTCERERASLPSQAGKDDRFVPECTADGRYNPVQCHTATGYCWCVRVDSGRPLPGSAARNRIPDCTGAAVAQTNRGHWEKPLPGCPGAQKKQFLQSLIRALQLEAEHAGSPSINQTSPPPPSTSPWPSSIPPFPTAASTASSSYSSSSSSSPLSVPASTAPPVAAEPSGPETALRWHFARLDVDSSGVLSEREGRPLRQFVRQRLKPRRCAKKFAQYCDQDGDRSLTLAELELCLGL